MDTAKYRIDGSKPLVLTEHSTKHDKSFESKILGLAHLEENSLAIRDLQARLIADGKAGVLVLFQGMDASGKDGITRTVFAKVNQSGINVFSFKQPTAEELAHDYLWRLHKRVPERGLITVFNRSYYEDVLIAKVRKLYDCINTIDRCKGPQVIEQRYEQIRNYEKYLWENGIVVLKFMLNVSKKEQCRRFIRRIDDSNRNWKFSMADISERTRWNEYQAAYEECINSTATPEMPWYIIPCDDKWFARATVSQIVRDSIEDLSPQFPTMNDEMLEELATCRRLLLGEQAEETNLKKAEKKRAKVAADGVENTNEVAE